MRRCVPLLLLLLLLSLTPYPARAAGSVTLESLLRQMTDLSLLAEYPEPAYVTKQFSSYDRASEAPGRESWFANADRGFMLYDGAVKEKTPYFKGGPMQGRAPDGFFPAGTRVGIAPTHKPIGAYVWAYATAPDGSAVDGKIPQGYVEKSAITPDPQGHVLADMDGPGCVACIWSANPNEGGDIRIYLDGADKPVIEAPLETLLGGKWQTETDGKKWTPFSDPIACERSRGYNLYFPIAYQKHCKITVTKPDIYYHVDYRTYPKGTEAETFSLAALAGREKELAATAATLAGKQFEPVPVPPRTLGAVTIGKGGTDQLNPPRTKEVGQDLGKGLPGVTLTTETRETVRLTGPGVVSMLYVQLAGVKDVTAALRQLVLVGTFDGAATPQVWCPLGDFFGSGPGANPSQALPFRVRRLGDQVDLLARWPMPFAKSAVFAIHNLGEDYISGSIRPGKDEGKPWSTLGPWVGLHLYASPYKWTDRSMHFHAKWRTETFKTRPFRDWTYCDLKGQGVFVGDVLSIFNPVPAWWGEGDEKIYVDGETFPSWFGTGSEDYYAYAWSDPKPFQHAYHNQTRCDGPGTRGHTSVNRLHILDAIPFQKSFRFDMEVWHWTPNINVTYAAVSYWYARTGATDDFKEADAKILQNIPSLPAPPHIIGAIEGEKMKVLGKSGTFDVGPQDLSEFTEGQWSGASHLWVRPSKAGEWVDLELPVAADGKYHVLVYLTKARDYGIIQFKLDGKALGEPIDCFEPEKVVSTGAIDLGAVDLKKGPATLRVEVVGTNDRSIGLRHMWGLDCVVLKPAR